MIFQKKKRSIYLLLNPVKTVSLCFGNNLLLLYFFLVIQALGEQLKMRQQVIATATIYFKRFYAR